MNILPKIFGPDPQITTPEADYTKELNHAYYRARQKFFDTYKTGWIDATREGKIITIYLRIGDNMDIEPMALGMSGHPNTVMAQQEAFLVACGHIGLDLPDKTEADLTTP